VAAQRVASRAVLSPTELVSQSVNFAVRVNMYRLRYSVV
jgi:hypothetical protein